MAPSISLEQFAVDLTNPLHTAAGTIDQRRGFVLRIETDSTVAYGEATPLAGWTESFDRCEEVLTEAVDTLRSSGVSALRDGIGPVDVATPAARHALALARLDLAAQRSGLPLAQFLTGGGPRTAVPVNATIGDGSVPATVAAAETAVDAGYQCVKCKVGVGTVSRDIARLRAIRSAVGPTIGLRADANGAWDQTQAAHLLRAVEDVDCQYIEQPLAPGALAETAALRSVGTTAIGLDEECRQTSIDRLVRSDALDVLVIKPMVVGGIDRALRIARLARIVGDLTPVITTTIDGPLAQAGAVHLAAAIDPDVACGLATADRLAGPTPATLQVSDGQLPVSQAPGCSPGLTEEIGIENWYGCEP